MHITYIHVLYIGYITKITNNATENRHAIYGTRAYLEILSVEYKYLQSQ